MKSFKQITEAAKTEDDWVFLKVNGAIPTGKSEILGFRKASKNAPNFPSNAPVSSKDNLMVVRVYKLKQNLKGLKNIDAISNEISQYLRESVDGILEASRKAKAEITTFEGEEIPNHVILQRTGAKTYRVFNRKTKNLIGVITQQKNGYGVRDGNGDWVASRVHSLIPAMSLYLGVSF